MLSHIIDQSANVVLALATVALAVATIALARWTKTLSRLTERLVKIEDARDERDSLQKRRSDLSSALWAIQRIQRIRPDEFAHALNTPGSLPTDDMDAIEMLHSLKRYVEDPDCHQHLHVLCMNFDSVRREKENIRINEADIGDRVRRLQTRIQWFVDEARAEISSSHEADNNRRA